MLAISCTLLEQVTTLTLSLVRSLFLTELDRSFESNL